MRERRMRRLLLACVASLAVVFAAAFLVAYLDTLQSAAWGVGLALVVAEGTALGALAVIVLWGIPAYLFLKSRSKHSLLWYAIAGAIPGFVVVGIFRPFGEDDPTTLVLQGLYLGLVGSLAAATFWAINRTRHA